MAKNLFKDVFGFSDTEIEKMIDDASEWFEDIINEAMKNEATKSYFNAKSCSYNNGKLIKKCEKEYVDGKCIKNNEFDSTKSINDEQTCSCKCNENCGCGKTKLSDKKKGNYITTKDVKERAIKKIKVQNEIINTLEESNKRLKEQIDDMTNYIDGLNDKIKQCENEKAELKAIVDNIKKCF